MTSKFTFKNLDDMINVFCLNLKEFENVFFNQFQDSQNVIFNVECNNEKLNTVKQKLSKLHFTNFQIEEEIKNATSFIDDMEHKVGALEKNIQHTYGGHPVDEARKDVYGMIGNINCCIENYKNDVEMFISNTSNSYKPNQAEDVVQMMIEMMESLQQMEINMEKMKSQIAKSKSLAGKIKFSKTNLNIT